MGKLQKESQSCKVEGFKTTRSTESSQEMQNIQKNCIFSRVSEATLGSFPVYKGFKNMGKSTQKVGKGDLVSNSFSSLLPQSHGKSREVARLKASKLQEAPKTAKNASFARSASSSSRPRQSFCSEQNPGRTSSLGAACFWRSFRPSVAWCFGVARGTLWRPAAPAPAHHQQQRQHQDQQQQQETGGKGSYNHFFYGFQKSSRSSSSRRKQEEKVAKIIFFYGFQKLH